MSASPLPHLVGRVDERATLDEVLACVRRGSSAVCVLRGGAGVGKSVLLDYVAAQASGITVTRALGVEADMELAYAGLQQLCAPFLGQADRLPEPQRDALQVAFGTAAGDPPARFLVGLAVLTLLTRASEARPVLVVVDDAHWLDRASLLTLEFVARRLLAESVALVAAVRDPEGSAALAGLDELRVDGLDPASAGELIDSAVDGRLEARVRDRVVAETHGNPLALLELYRGRSAAELSYGLDATRPEAVPDRVEEDFARRAGMLPSATRSLLLVAAAEPAGDTRLLLRAAEHLGVVPDAAPAKAAGLVEFGDAVRFRHPLARSAVYRSANPAERRAVHSALAWASDPVHDPDRRAWHAAQACDGPDEEAADGLERAADRARRRGGIAAEAVLLERATDLTPEPDRRGRRALTAAEAHFSAAALDRATAMATVADLCPLDATDRARVSRLRARVLFARSRSDEAAPLLLDAAAQLSAAGSPLARETYLEAISAAVFSGRVHGPAGVAAAATAATAARRPGAALGTSPSDSLLDAIATLLADGPEQGVGAVRAALGPFAHEELDGPESTLRWLLLAPVALEAFFHHAWDFVAWDEISARAVRLARGIGALGVLPTLLVYTAGVDVFHGDLDAAARKIEEADVIASATGNAPFTYASLVLTAWRGEERPALALFDDARTRATRRGEASLLAVTGYVQGVLCNGLARYADALDASRAVVEHDGFNFVGLSLIENVEAAVRCGEPHQAASSFARLDALTRVADTGWARGIRARCRALLSEGDEADRLYRAAIEHLDEDRVTAEVARAHLLYGEWLRREGRRRAAREHLRTAYDLFAAMPAAAFAERARRELAATGVKVRAPAEAIGARLTPQEAQIAALAAEGMTNPTIGAHLFLSPHTVEWHLRKVYTKLGIGSRRELAGVLALTAGGTPARV
ncbi:AAA family ATPase [Isoptericola sp. 4D.3]|uniref:AAA family ATPase n=1 Tax=Isoptericola peretonis TaxID=2918523 RepID=A0ABT0J185_9MICO|nr:AAA family ATPase [Isoptericola sp. 4D.3]